MLIHVNSEPFQGEDVVTLTSATHEDIHGIARPSHGIWWRWHVTMGMADDGRPLHKMQGWAEGPEDAEEQMRAAALRLGGVAS